MDINVDKIYQLFVHNDIEKFEKELEYFEDIGEKEKIKIKKIIKIIKTFNEEELTVFSLRYLYSFNLNYISSQTNRDIDYIETCLNKCEFSLVATDSKNWKDALFTYLLVRIAERCDFNDEETDMELEILKSKVSADVNRKIDIIIAKRIEQSERKFFKFGFDYAYELLNSNRRKYIAQKL